MLSLLWPLRLLRNIEWDWTSSYKEFDKLALDLVDKSGDVDLDPRAAVVREVEAEIAALLHEISDADAWKLHGTSMGTSVLLRTTNTYDNLLRFRSEKLMDVSIFSLLAAVNEHEDYEKFMPGLDTVELLSSPSKFRRTLRLSGKKPWPLNRTEMILEAYGGKVKVTPIPTHV